MSKKGRSLSAEDLAIWNQVASSTTPIRKTPIKTPLKPKPRIADSFSVSSSSKPAVVAKPVARPDFQNLAQRHETPLRMDARKHKKMRGGKLSPDATIDLHGMTAAAAHSMLTRFVLNAHARGDRLILVITGKGKTNDSQHVDPTRQRGILRQSVPKWLSLAPLGQIVLQVTTANQRHGGEGAYYVYLKRQR